MPPPDQSPEPPPPLPPRLRDLKDERYAMEIGGARRSTARDAKYSDPRLFEKMTGLSGPDGYSLVKSRRPARSALIVGALGAALLTGVLFLLSKNLGGRAPSPLASLPDRINSEAPRKTAIQFLEASEPEAKAALCRHPHQALPEILRFYGQGATTADAYAAVRGMGLEPLGDQFGYLFQVRLKDGGDRLLPVLSREDGSFAIDFACFARLGSMPWSEFLDPVPPPGNPEASREGTFRAFLRQGNYYNFEFGDPETHACFRLESPDLDQRIFGYATKDGAVFQHLTEAIRGKQLERVTVALATTPAKAANRQVEIVGLLTLGWVLPDAPIPEPGPTPKTSDRPLPPVGLFHWR